eukprot:6172255-Pleurochrysis_carterae.AAC.2
MRSSMLSSDADVSKSLPARRAFTVATGPLAHTMRTRGRRRQAPLFSLSHPVPRLYDVFEPFSLSFLLVEAAYPTLCEGMELAFYAASTYFVLVLRKACSSQGESVIKHWLQVRSDTRIAFVCATARARP